ncbi:MAG TPA: bifunctional sugar-1-phosphate nucleotidylyltransferase/acetyltransferase [Candidatus Thermoplasmatota archaeon]|nr:bifunctional sugar-1-phosphate nucleotidylyltransferase/acetyltransferase [Candidatus Thermoplasmatota archaeon]
MVTKAVILAAGEGKRLRPFTETMPKVMLPVANKPILEYVLNAVKKSGIEEVFLVVGYKKEVIMEYFEDYKGVTITYINQDKQLGTAHALLQAKRFIKEPFIVLAGDNIIDSSSIQRLMKDPSEYTILIKEHPYPSKYGVVFVENKKISRIVEKPKEDIGKYISTGIYKLPHSVFAVIERCSSQGIHALSTVIQTLVDEGKHIDTVLASVWMDIVYPWDLISVNEAMIQGSAESTNGTIEKGVTLKGPVTIGKDTTIYAGCYIVGPAVIGEGCEIGPHACIFPSTTIGNNSVVHPFSVIRSSVIMNDVHISSNSHLSHSVIGKGCILGDNFSTIPDKTIIESDNEFHKLDAPIGAMIGEDCVIDSHVVVQPGRIIGRKCHISPLTNIYKNIPSESKVM